MGCGTAGCVNERSVDELDAGTTVAGNCGGRFSGGTGMRIEPALWGGGEVTDGTTTWADGVAGAG